MENKKKTTLIVGLITIGFIFLVFASTLFTHYKHSHIPVPQQEETLEKERVDVTLEYIPQIDWADMALFFHISHVRAQTKKTQAPLLGSVTIPTIITCDIEAKESLNHLLFLAHFLDSKGRDVLRSKPVQIEPENEQIIESGWKPGNKGIAYFVIDKEKLSQAALIRVTKRIKD